MKRAIKFRAWDKYYKNFLEWEKVKELVFGEILEDEDFIIDQFTGLRDKNGQEIYEGDLIRSNSMIKPNVFEVIYGRCSFEFIRVTGSRYRSDQLLWSDIEVIGHIHKTGKSRKLDILYQESLNSEGDSNLPF